MRHYRQNQYDGSIVPPFKKNRISYFGGYEGFRMRQGQTFGDTVPTVGARPGECAGLHPLCVPLSNTMQPSRSALSWHRTWLGNPSPDRGGMTSTLCR